MYSTLECADEQPETSETLAELAPSPGERADGL